MTAHDATAIQVHYDDKIVGWLNHYDGSKAKIVSLEITTATECGGGFGEPHIDSRMFTLKRLRRNFSAEDRMRMSIEEFAERVAKYCPSYAVETRLAMSDHYCFEWMALKLDTFEEYEWIFEHHCFVAADAPTDFEGLKDAKASAPVFSVGSVAGVPTVTLPAHMIADGSITADRITGMSADTIIMDDAVSLLKGSWIEAGRRTGKSTATAEYAKKMAEVEAEKAMYEKVALYTRKAIEGDAFKSSWGGAVGGDSVGGGSLLGRATESTLTASSYAKLLDETLVGRYARKW